MTAALELGPQPLLHDRLNLAVTEQVAGEVEEIELYLFAYSEDEEGAVYEDIEDEAVYAKVRAACEALLEM